MTKTGPIEEVYDKIAKCGDMAADLGADILGLERITRLLERVGNPHRARTSSNGERQASRQLRFQGVN